MALAPFFEKNAVAAAQLLRGYEKESFERCLLQRSPAIVFDGSAAEGGMAKLVTELLVNLLARLYPAIALVPLDESARAYEKELRQLAASINPVVDFIEPHADALQLVLGKSKPPVSGGERPLFIGAKGWSAMLSRTGPVALDETANPFGGGMAACLAAANAFRHTFADQLERAELDGEVEISVAEILGAPEASPAGSIEIGRTHLVGVGAIGQAFLWALTQMTCRGILEVVDNEEVELSNVQRYVLTKVGDEGKWKVDFALLGAELEVHKHKQTWGEFLAESRPAVLDRVLVAVDSAAARCAVQTSLPWRILNAWTQPLNLGISRHSLDDPGACLMCLYLPRRSDKNQDEIVREALRLAPESGLEVRHLLARGDPLSDDFVARVAAANSVPVDLLKGFVGRSLAQLYSEAVCGSTLLRVPGGQDIQTPMAFQSALAGILLAGELVLDSKGTRQASTRSTLNLLRPIAAQETSFADGKHESGSCICQDADYLDAYRRKHSRHISS